MKEVYDIAVVGSGFAGSIFAMIARRLGRSVLLLEQGRHPRVVIGESSTPLSNLLLEDLALQYDLPALKPLTKWGTWQRSYPDLACGLKRGFTFYHHDLEHPAHRSSMPDQLLVAASPHDDIADTHWYRADLDEFLVRQAQSLGVEFVDEVRLGTFVDEGRAVLLSGSKNGRDVTFRTRFVVDATGPRGFLHRTLRLAEAPLPSYPSTEALYSHFSQVKRLDTLSDHLSSKAAPYPIDDAAVHHVFDGGWIWVLQFSNGITSAGVAATAESSQRLGLSTGEEAWGRLLSRIPALADQFADRRREQPFTYVSQLSFRSSVIAGERWAMLPSAAGFVDPLLSTGFPLALLGVSRLAEIIEHSWNTPALSDQLQGYAVKTQGELLATARLIAALYANIKNFPVFRSLSLLYFAAASFSETARRLGKPDLAKSFLLHDDPLFGVKCEKLLARVNKGVRIEDSRSIARAVRELIEPIDVAGLCREPRDFCYPVLAEDLIGNAWKLGATRQDAVELLERAGFAAGVRCD